jgi:hypothetical protein
MVVRFRSDNHRNRLHLRPSRVRKNMREMVQARLMKQLVLRGGGKIRLTIAPVFSGVGYRFGQSRWGS